MHRASFHDFSATISFCSCCLQHSTYTIELHIWDCIWESVEAKAIRGDGWTLKHQDLEEGKLFLLSMFLLCILCWSFAVMPWTCVLCAFEWFWFVFVSCAFELMFCCRLCYKLLVCASNICALCILCYELLKRRLWVVSFWFVFWAFGIWTFYAMNSRRKDFRVSKGVGVWVV